MIKGKTKTLKNDATGFINVKVEKETEKRQKSVGDSSNKPTQ